MQLLAVFMQLDTRGLLMNYIDLRQTKDVQLTFDALLVRFTVVWKKKKPNKQIKVKATYFILSIILLKSDGLVYFKYMIILIKERVT